MVKIALYIGDGQIGNWGIRKWTGRKESHCELIVNSLSYSSSLMDGGVRRKYILYSPSNWYIINIPWAIEENILSHYEKTKGNKYGLLSLVSSQIFNRNTDDSEADFCSEWCARALGLPSPNSYSPGTLADMVHFLNKNNFSMQES